MREKEFFMFNILNKINVQINELKSVGIENEPVLFIRLL